MIPLYTPECRQCKFCLSRKTNLCQKIRATQGKGLMPDGTSRFSIDGKPMLHYMGTSTFANHIVVPEIALAKIRPDAPFDIVCYIGCGVTTGVGAVLFTAKVEAGANVVVFGLGGIGLNVIQGAKLVGADKIIGIDLNPAREAMARKFGMTHFINPKDVRQRGRRDRAAHRRRRRLQLRVHRQHDDDAPGARVLPQGLGPVASSSASPPAGAEIATRPFQLVTGRQWKGSAFGGARGRTDVPRIVDWYMDGKIAIDDADHAPAEARGDQRGLRADEARRVDPLGGGVLSAPAMPNADRRPGRPHQLPPSCRRVARSPSRRSRLGALLEERVDHFVWDGLADRVRLPASPSTPASGPAAPSSSLAEGACQGRAHLPFHAPRAGPNAARLNRKPRASCCRPVAIRARFACSPAEPSGAAKGMTFSRLRTEPAQK